MTRTFLFELEIDVAMEIIHIYQDIGIYTRSPGVLHVPSGLG